MLLNLSLQTFNQQPSTSLSNPSSHYANAIHQISDEKTGHNQDYRYDDSFALSNQSTIKEKTHQYANTTAVITPSSIELENQEMPPDWSLNYQADDYQEATATNNSFSTRDLISWSVQIARGMDYLASKKVMHGDLALRNVLLADDRVAKVADFGLARQLYNDYDYKKQGKVS